MGRDWKRYCQSADERSVTAAPDTVRVEPPEPIVVISLSGHLCGNQTHRFELRSGSRGGRYRVYVDTRF